MYGFINNTLNLIEKIKLTKKIKIIKVITKITITFLLIKCQFIPALAKTTATVHFCKFNNGVVGYYDRPCEYVNIVDSNKHDNNILEQTVVSKEVNNQQVTKSKINHTASRRCNNAITKIASIQDLLQNQYLNSNSSYKKILSQLKRSLNRYNKIKEQYCS